MRTALFWVIVQQVVVIPPPMLAAFGVNFVRGGSGITSAHRVITQKSAVLVYLAVQAWNQAGLQTLHTCEPPGPKFEFLQKPLWSDCILVGEKNEIELFKTQTWTYKIKCLCTYKKNMISLFCYQWLTLKANPVPLMHKDDEEKMKRIMTIFTNFNVKEMCVCRTPESCLWNSRVLSNTVWIQLLYRKEVAAEPLKVACGTLGFCRTQCEYNCCTERKWLQNPWKLPVEL